MKKSSIPEGTSQLPALHYVYRLLSLCSLRCLFRLAHLVGFVVQRTRNQVSMQTWENIDLCLPSLPQSQRQQLYRESIVHLCSAFLELAAIWYHPVAKSLAKVEIAHIDHGFYESGRGKIVVVPHHGSWEMMIYWLGQQGPTYTLYKPARRKPMDAFIFHRRSRNGVHMVPTSTAGLRRLLAGLKKNATCMVLPDQRPRENTGWIESSFFKQPARTSLLIKNLAQRVECDIFIATLSRRLDTGRYQLHMQRLERSELLQEDLASATYLNQRIEEMVSDQICQYQWSYRRFDESAYQAMRKDIMTGARG